MMPLAFNFLRLSRLYRVSFLARVSSRLMGAQACVVRRTPRTQLFHRWAPRLRNSPEQGRAIVAPADAFTC